MGATGFLNPSGDRLGNGFIVAQGLGGWQRDVGQKPSQE